MNARPLIVMAMQEESRGLLEQAGFEVIYTGIGKINATHALTRALLGRRAKGQTPWVLNLGSAGSPVFKTGELVEASRFVQRDMDATGIGFAFGQTPFDPHPSMLVTPRRFEPLPAGVCGSGDSFLQGPSPIACDIVDMEAYAYAKTCLMESVPFACAKYITDGADHKAHADWQVNLERAADAFLELLHKI